MYGAAHAVQEAAAVLDDGIDGEAALGIPTLSKRNFDASGCANCPQCFVGKFAQPEHTAVNLTITENLANNFLDRKRLIGDEGRSDLQQSGRAEIKCVQLIADRRILVAALLQWPNAL